MIFSIKAIEYLCKKIITIIPENITNIVAKSKENKIQIKNNIVLPKLLLHRAIGLNFSWM